MEMKSIVCAVCVGIAAVASAEEKGPGGKGERKAVEEGGCVHGHIISLGRVDSCKVARLAQGRDFAQSSVIH